jgi:hypothetical protein
MRVVYALLSKIDGRTPIKRSLIVILALAMLGISVRGFVVAAHDEHQKDLGAGVLYDPFVVQGTKSTYYGVHIELASEHRSLKTDDTRDNPLYALAESAPGNRLPVQEVDIYPYINQVSGARYNGRWYQVESTPGEDRAFVSVFGACALVLLAVNGTGLVRARWRAG